MTTLTPSQASSLSAGVYAVLTPELLKAFYARYSNLFGAAPKVINADTGARLVNGESSFAICARGEKEYKNDAFFVFRGTTGTNYGADIITDLRIGVSVSAGNDLVHSGFYQTFRSMTAELGSFIAKHPDVTTVHCVGHSLGGAIATLAADWVNRTLGKKAKLYTFGAPRVGYGFKGFSNKLTAKLGNSNIHRVYHGNDPVTMIPVFPYSHVPNPGYGHYLPYAGVVINPKAHFIRNYVSSVGGASWEQLRRLPPLTLSTTNVKQWLKSSSPANLNDSSVWEKLNYALAYVAQAALATLQPVFVGTLTIADQLAMILQKGLTKGKEISGWVFHIIRRLMQMLGMKLLEKVEDLTTAVIRLVLNRIINKLAEDVRRAIRSLR
ncbi:lipase family protein [Teredinibacter sp. KSP-S5-2]|uniref:lipase family protein n=1 Tax=Teredinibacter sp. KSP-S5-2 TaxID=3034506 RepID=UPI002934D720|nr:lipase family protein [Teredinibacter sp. KSP-S5-2]WNO08049.1 lipase family protein [Teredinibacter sp. KSP-S5-2]